MNNAEKPAFANMPSHTNPKNTVEDYGGLTKREYFAAMALQGMLANKDAADFSKEACAEICIGYTDELLTQLENDPKK